LAAELGVAQHQRRSDSQSDNANSRTGESDLRTSDLRTSGLRKPDLRNGVLFDFRYIPDSEIATYFAAAGVVLAPYRVEAQSGVALTSFHFARPVIATTVGGLPEVIDGTNGILVPPEDPSALAR